MVHRSNGHFFLMGFLKVLVDLDVHLELCCGSLGCSWLVDGFTASCHFRDSFLTQGNLDQLFMTQICCV